MEQFFTKYPELGIVALVALIFAVIGLAYYRLYQSIKDDQRTPEQIRTDGEVLAGNAFAKAVTNEPLP